jgi:hypothetical protein
VRPGRITFVAIGKLRPPRDESNLVIVSLKVNLTRPLPVSDKKNKRLTKPASRVYKALRTESEYQNSPLHLQFLPPTTLEGMAHFSNPHSHHLFALPAPLLETLTPRNDISLRDLTQKSEPVADEGGAAKIDEFASSRDPTIAPTSTTSGRSCNVCQGTSFANVEDQRNHFRSDWHRYNVKLRLNGKDVVAESEFNRLIEGKLLAGLRN